MVRKRNPSRPVRADSAAAQAVDGGLLAPLAFLLDGGLAFSLLGHALAPDGSSLAARVGGSTPSRLARRATSPPASRPEAA
jgi:hypothetical protein